MIDLKQLDQLAEALGIESLRALVTDLCDGLAGLVDRIARCESADCADDLAALLHTFRGRVALFGCSALADSLGELEPMAAAGLTDGMLAQRIDSLRAVSSETAAGLADYVRLSR